MAKKISGAEYPLSKIFSSEFEYIIPSYQRPYAWTTDQTSELIDDLIDFYEKEADEGYFLGSIVLIKEESVPRSEVIDGQQRLTTLTILLAGLTSLTDGDQRATLYRYIVEPGNEFEGLEPKPRLTMRERDRTFFSRYIQELDFEGLANLGAHAMANESQENIKTNAELLLKRINAKFNADPAALRSFIQFLMQRCFLVAVSTPSQKSAFRVFSVMNSRGLDLQPTDIIKADVVGQLTSAVDQESYNQRWEDMEVELGRAAFNDLFAYVRMIYAQEKAKRSLLEEFRSHVISQVGSPRNLIEKVLEPYAETLAVLRNAAYESVEDANEINRYLRWLNRIDNSDWLPPAMVFLTRKQDETLYVLWFFRQLERLASYLHVSGKNVNQRIERYSELLAELEGNHTIDNPVQTVLLREDEKIEFQRALDGDVYQLAPKRRSFVVLRLDSFVSDGAATYDSGVLTIEHVLPQTVDPDSEWSTTWPDVQTRSQWVHRIANLVPLNKRRNSQARNYDFDKKKSAYFAGRSNVSSYALTSQVLNTPEWTPDVVAQRQSELLSVLARGWDLDVHDGE